jgi:hypothetical protein
MLIEGTRGGNPPLRRTQPKKEPNFKQAMTTFLKLLLSHVD